MNPVRVSSALTIFIIRIISDLSYSYKEQFCIFVFKVGLERPEVIEAMLACLVYDQLGKVQLWRAELQQCVPNFYESIADQRVLLQALQDDNHHRRARFLPSFTSLQVIMTSTFYG